MKRSRAFGMALVVVLAGVGVYGTLAANRVDPAAIPQDGSGPRLRVMILGDSNDPRVTPAREAVGHWNTELRRLGRRVHFDSAVVHDDSVSDDLSHTDLISFSVRWRPGSQGVVGVRRADIPPLSLPNTVRNVIAHELGHVLGLNHNSDSTTLMCGRPASCRPAAFASDSGRFFPLTADDERRLAERWP